MRKFKNGLGRNGYYDIAGNYGYTTGLGFGYGGTSGNGSGKGTGFNYTMIRPTDACHVYQLIQYWK